MGFRENHEKSLKNRRANGPWRVRSSAATPDPLTVHSGGFTPLTPRRPFLAYSEMGVPPLAPPCFPRMGPGPPWGSPAPPPRNPRGALGLHLATPLDPLDSSLLGGTLRALVHNFLETLQSQKDYKRPWFFDGFGSAPIKQTGSLEKKGLPGAPLGPPPG